MGGAGGPLSGRLIAPLSGVDVTSRRPDLHWRLPAGSDGARVEICGDRRCTTRTTTFFATGSSGAPTADLPPGVAFWRVYFSSGGVVAAQPTPTWELRVPSRGSAVDRTAGMTTDVNGDGYADVVVVVWPKPDQLVRAYAYYGGPAGLGSSPSVALNGVSPTVQPLGFVAANLGDVNGDGYSDVAVGYNVLAAPFGSNSVGYVSIYMGGPSGLPADPGLTLVAPPPLYDDTAYLEQSYFGTAVSSVGDVNGDGYSDFVVGDWYAAGGLAHLYLGGPMGPSSLPASTLYGFSDAFGSSAGSAGDVDGDGFGDMVVVGTSEAWVFPGNPDGVATTPFPTAMPSSAVHPVGYHNMNNTGASFTSSGDINGDGFSDIVFAAWQTTGLLVNDNFGLEGMGEWYFGSGGGPVTSPAGPQDSPAPVLLGTETIFFSPPNTLLNRETAIVLANAGDVNGDGYGDVVLGANQYMNQTGRVLLYTGVPGSLGLSTTPSLLIPGPQGAGQGFGTALCGPGDIDGDGFSDVAVSTRTGNVYVFNGGAAGLSSSPSIVLSAPDDKTMVFGETLAK